MFELSRACGLGAALLIGVLAGTPLAARAQVYKCVQANGATAFQSTPCPTGAKPVPHPTAAQLNAQQATQPKDDKPYDDPYKMPVSERPHPQVPALGQNLPDAPVRPQARPEDPPSTSRLVAGVQARNRLESRQQAFNEAHRNDPSPQRTANCETARQNVNVLNEQRPVYTYDDKGNHKYVEDADRAAALARAQQQVSENCR